MRKAYKSIISLAVVLIAGLNFIVPAFGQDPFTAVAIGGLGGLSGAGLFGSMASMSGVNISWGNNTSDEMDAMWNNLNPDHVYFSGESHEADPLEDPEDIYDYITVDIGDWLEAQSDFIVNFIQENNVTDNSHGNIGSVYSFEGIPLNNYYEYRYWSDILGTFISPSNIGETASLEVGPFKVIRTKVSDGADNDFYYNGVLVGSGHVNNASSGSTLALRLRCNDEHKNVTMAITWPNNYLTSGGLNSTIGQPVNSSQTSWTSSTVNSSVFDGWESAKVKIPHNLNILPVNWDIPDFVNAINELWENQLQGHIVIEDTDQPVPPVPPTPIPDTPLGNVPFDDWVDLWGQGIYQQLENQSDALDFIGSNGEDQIEELESIDSNLEDLNQTAESIDTNIGTGIGLLGGIKTGIDNAVDFLEGIAEHVGELVEEIVEGTETLIAGILNQIPSVFGVIFGPIKQASSIWHYVVEWIQSILAPMSWIWTMASGTSYNIILPVYASLAGAVVLAFYKRFGK